MKLACFVKAKFIGISISAFFLFLPFLVFASSDNGGIPLNSFAWSDRIGWINFGTTNGNVHVIDTALTGYVWSQNYGWINLAPAGAGVKNNGNGDLTGHAWGEKLGYINFYGVTITAAGVFTGTATGPNVGTITFNCFKCKVTTDWQHTITRQLGNQPAGGSGGGGFSSPIPPPPIGYQVSINSGLVYTTSSIVTLQFNAGSDVSKFTISNTPNFANVPFLPYTPTLLWDLCGYIVTSTQARSQCPEGEYSVYTQFYTSEGISSGLVSSSIIYTSHVPETAPPPTSTIPYFVSKVKEFFKSLLPGLFGGPPPQAPPAPQVTVSKEAPLALSGKWDLISEAAINQFVFAPLPQAIALLLDKFPELKKTFFDVGIIRESDLAKLQAITLSLPGITEAIGFSLQNLAFKKLVLPQVIPIAGLSPEARGAIPTGVVFARSLGEKMDFNVSLKINEAGTIDSQINAIAGTPIHLVVKPERPAKRVRGFLVFNQRNGEVSQEAGYHYPTQNFFGSLISSILPPISIPAAKSHFLSLEGVELAAVSETAYRQLVSDTQPQVEKRLALLEFDYKDQGDGIYAVDIVAPVVDGKYEIDTRIDYIDETIGSKEIKLIAVVDPEGYVFEREGDRETRIPGAVVSLYWLRPDSNKYELWPGKDYNQENPQVTDVRGTYAFLVPTGFYYITVDAPGYNPYQGKTFEVRKGSSGIHTNIALASHYWWVKFLNWQTTLLLAVVLFLIYNFYEDRKRAAMSYALVGPRGGGFGPAGSSIGQSQEGVSQDGVRMDSASQREADQIAFNQDVVQDIATPQDMVVPQGVVVPKEPVVPPDVNTEISHDAKEEDKEDFVKEDAGQDVNQSVNVQEDLTPPGEIDQVQSKVFEIKTNQGESPSEINQSALSEVETVPTTPKEASPAKANPEMRDQSGADQENVNHVNPENVSRENVSQGGNTTDANQDSAPQSETKETGAKQDVGQDMTT